MEVDESETQDNGDVYAHGLESLSEKDRQRLEAQNARLIPSNKAEKFEKAAKRHWDIFYKNNETKFFKDRRWTTREFQELINFDPEAQIVFLELGCGVGNMVFPLVEEGFSNFFFYACDFSPRAVDLVKANELYDELKMMAFCADLTTDDLFENMEEGSVDIASLIFVLSAIQPSLWSNVAKLAHRVLKPGGILLFRDYGLHDMAQIRFKPGHKISENYYMRQDGTRSYFFSVEELQKLFMDNGFEILMNTYVKRRTINRKEELDVGRIFVQGKFRKPATNGLYPVYLGLRVYKMNFQTTILQIGDLKCKITSSLSMPRYCLDTYSYRLHQIKGETGMDQSRLQETIQKILVEYKKIGNQRVHQGDCWMIRRHQYQKIPLFISTR